MFAIYSKGAATLILRGKPYTLSADHPRYEDLVAAINIKNEDDALAIVTANDTLAEVLGVFGDVSVHYGHISYKGQHLPANYLAQQILAFQKAGRDIEPLARFLDLAMQNPDARAAADLYRWCEAGQMPISSDGRIIGYKIVNNDFFDSYTRTFDNSPGQIVQQDRSLCDPNPEQTCSRGLHFCSAAYLPNYGPSNKRVVLVAVSPTDVVAFPTDYNLSKARCCKYEVLHEIDPSTAAEFFPVNTLVYDGPDEDEDEDEVDPTVAECKAYAEARGYKVSYYDGDWDWLAPDGRSAHDWAASEDEAWANAYDDATYRGLPVIAVSVTRPDPTITNRVQALLDHLGLPAGAMAVALDRVEQNLGISPNDTLPFVDRIVTCEQIMGNAR